MMSLRPSVEKNLLLIIKVRRLWSAKRYYNFSQPKQKDCFQNWFE